MNATAPKPNAEPVFASRRKISLVAIHCSATPDDRTLFYNDVGTRNLRTPVDEIDTWHWDRGFRRKSAAIKAFNPTLRAIGYHFVIARNGAVFTGRHPDEVPAHAKGFNTQAMSICLIGSKQYTLPQWSQLAELVRNVCAACAVPLMITRPASPSPRGVCGHRDLSPDLDHNGRITPNEFVKLCPGFNVCEWLSGDLKPLAAHVAPEVRK
jgi:N-acetylmuramoyl-L-alanine amidase